MPEPQCSIEELIKTIVEQNVQITELQSSLVHERERNETLMKTVNNLRASTTSLLNTCEQAQEGISNRLIKEISRLKNMQLAMCDDVEAQEARLVDVLEERLRTLKAEKVELENALEQEQERIVNKLQRQMDELKLVTGFSDQGSVSTSPIAFSDQINIAVAHHIEREAELQRQIAKLREENQRLLWENVKLQNKLRRQSIEDSPLIEPISPTLIPLRRSDSVSSTGGSSFKGKSGSLTELHLYNARKSFRSDSKGNQSDSEPGPGGYNLRSTSRTRLDHPNLE